MTISQAGSKYAQVVQTFAPQSKLLRAWDLQGGVSARVTALEIERPDGQREKLLARQHGAADLASNPQIAADEFGLLHVLRSVGLPAPTPYHFDQSGEIFATPYIIIEYIEGQTEFAPAHLDDFLLQCAAQLARIHQVDGARPDIAFLPRQAEKYAQKLRERPAKLDESLQERQIRDALAAVWPLPQQNPSALLHGDFWPGNLLWRDGQLVGVIDWEDAALGDPLADVANSRLEMLWAFGIDAMQRFTEQYQALTRLDWAHLPYWDLCAALRHAAHAADWANYAAGEETTRAGYRWFITQAFEERAVHGKRRVFLSEGISL
ncbi:MAG TPA: phosphotransferase [Ktedonobacterales bacterium]|jgi:aminoglycoside phosphotransferase (APT) family kinase protein